MLTVPLVFGVSVMAQQVEYHVTIDEDDPLIATVIMDILEHNRSVLLYSRASALQTETQVRDVTCSGKTLLTNRDSEWVVPAGCNQVLWTVDIETESDEGIAAYDQKTILSKSGKWWIFSTPTALLRLRDETFKLYANFNVPYQSELSKKLPSGLQAPGYYALGDVPRQKVSYGNISLNYISDNPDLTAQFVKPDDHVTALNYLSAIMGVNQSEPKEITMVLLGITRQRQSLGGAAGNETMLVNYIFDSKSSSSKETYYPIIIALHEQIHQLLRGPHITWVSESLAHFYAAKATLKIYPQNPVVKAIADELYSSSTEGQPGLIEIQKRIDRLQDYEYYDNFYNQGSAFWNALDVMIQEATNHSESLDDYLALIMRTEFRKGEGFPRRLMRAFSFLPTGSLESLEDKYLF